VNEKFQNDDTVLLREVEKTLVARRQAGLEGLVGGLAAVVINTAPEDLLPAAEELLLATRLRFEVAMNDPLSDDAGPCLLLRDGHGADFLLKSRAGDDNPFDLYNKGAKNQGRQQARLETFLFTCRDLDRYVAIQKARGVIFATPSPLVTDAFSFIQTMPSIHTGNAVGLIEWKGRPGTYFHAGSQSLALSPLKAERLWQRQIRGLDHVATRVRARQRDAAILEFLSLTNYHFDFAVYVESLNSITNVARLSAGDYAQVFTSGIAAEAEDAGPTERFIANYGVRPHHLAFGVSDIEMVVAGLRAEGMHFLSDLVGSREEGLKQIFSVMSPQTMLVKEYIERYDGFDGFFTKNNVTRLTLATDRQ